MVAGERAKLLLGETETNHATVSICSPFFIISWQYVLEKHLYDLLHIKGVLGCFQILCTPSTTPNSSLLTPHYN